MEELLAADGADFPGPTCWVTKPLLRIDYAFLSPGLAACLAAGRRGAGPHSGPACGRTGVRRYGRVFDDASDHFPVVIDLDVPFASFATAG